MARKENGRPRRRGRRLAGGALRLLAWTAAVFAVLLAVLWAFVHSGPGRERGRSLVAARLTEALGREVSVGDFDLDLFPLSVTVYDLVIPGRTAAEPPVAAVPELAVTVDLSGLHRSRVHIAHVFVREPQLTVLLDPDGGTNLPQLESTEGGGNTEVTFGSLVVRDGTVRFGDLSLPLDLDAEALWLRAGGRGAGSDLELDIALAGPRITVTLPDARPYAGSVRGRLTTGSGGLDLTSLVWASPELTAEVDGRVTWGEGGSDVGLRVSAAARAELLARLGYSDLPITGALRLDGTLQADAGGEPAWWFDSTVGSDELTVGGVAARPLAVRDLSTALRVDPDGVGVRIDRATYAGGRVNGTVGLPAGAEPPRVETDFDFEDLAVPALAADWGLELGDTSGHLSGRAEYRFDTAQPEAGSGTVRWRLAPHGGETALPLSGGGTLALAGGRATTEDLEITAPGQRLTATAELDLRSGGGQVGFELATEDLAALAGGLAPPELAESLWMPAAGQGTVRGEVRLEADGPAVDTEVELTGLHSPGLSVDRLVSELRLRANTLEVPRLEARRGDGVVTVAGSMPVATEGPSVPLDLTVNLERWPAAELAAVLPEGTPGLAGPLSGEVRLGGGWDALVVAAELSARPFAVAGVEAQQVAVTAGWSPDGLTLEPLRVELPAGELRVAGSLGLTDGGLGALDLSLEGPGLDLAAEPLGGLFPGRVTGAVDLSVRAGGTAQEPSLEARLDAGGLAVDGRPLGEDGNASFAASWSQDELRAEGSLLGLLSLAGGGELRLPSAEGVAGRSDLAFELASDDLDALLRAGGVSLDETFAPASDLGGGLAGSLSVRGPVGGRPAEGAGLEARLILDSLAIRIARDHELRNLEPVVATWVDGLLEVQSFYIGGREGTELFVAGGFDLAAEDVPIDLKFQGQLDTEWAEPLIAGSELSGTLSVLGSVRGTAAAPLINGQGEIGGGRVILADFPHAFDQLEATLFFDPDGRVILDRLSAELAGGEVLAQGELRLPAPGSGESVEYRFQSQARGFGLRWPEGFLLRGDADVTVTGAEGEQQIVGAVELERAFYLEDVSLQVTQILRDALQRSRLEVGSPDESLAATQINVSIAGPLRVRNNLADLRGDIDLLVRGSLAQPAVLGSVTLEPGGEVTYSDTEYRVERGRLTFSNPYRIDPVIDLVATADVDRYNVTLQLAGTLERLDASFSSDPPLADLEVLQLVATGSAPSQDGAATSEDGSLTSSATGLIYGQAASVISERVNSLFGFDRFQVNPGIGGDVGFAVGKRLSKDLYVTVSNDPVNEIDYLVQAEWQVTETMTVVLTQRGDDQYAVDLRWENRF